MTHKWSLTVTVPPRSDPVDLNDAKAQLKLDESVTADDDLITRYIRAAVRRAERFTGRSLITQTLEMVLDTFPAAIDLPRPPIRSISSITYVDGDGATQTLAADQYVLDDNVIRPAFNVTWPTPRNQDRAVTVTYVAGYSTAFTVVGDTTAPVTATGHPYSDDDQVRVWTSGGVSNALPTLLSLDTQYHVVNSVAATTVELSATSGGTAIAPTDAGTGTHYIGIFPEEIRFGILLMLGQFYDHRADFVTGTIASTLPISVETMLSAYKWTSQDR